ncbi:MAG: hypothetical protein ACPL28_11605 [bacterium]
MRVLIKREITYFYLKNPMVIFLNVILVLFVIPSSMFPVFMSQDDIGSVVSVLHKLIPAMIIILLGAQLTAMQFYREKINKNFEVLLALYHDPVKIWFCKMVPLWIIIYFLYLIGLLFAFTILPLIASKVIQCKDFSFYLNLFLLSPLLGMAILGLNSVIQLLLDDIRVMNLSLIIFVFLFLFFLPQISKLIPLIKFLEQFSILSISASVFLIIISLVILKISPTEKYL